MVGQFMYVYFAVDACSITLPFNIEIKTNCRSNSNDWEDTIFASVLKQVLLYASMFYISGIYLIKTSK